MVKFELSSGEWNKSLTCWKELKKHILNDSTGTSKLNEYIIGLDSLIFSRNATAEEKKDSNVGDVSVDTFTQIMDEIDHEVDGKNIEHVDTDGEFSKCQDFISNPV